MIDTKLEEYNLYRNLSEVINQFSNKFSEETNGNDVLLRNSIIVGAIAQVARNLCPDAKII